MCYFWKMHKLTFQSENMKSSQRLLALSGKYWVVIGRKSQVNSDNMSKKYFFFIKAANHHLNVIVIICLCESRMEFFWQSLYSSSHKSSSRHHCNWNTISFPLFCHQVAVKSPHTSFPLCTPGGSPINGCEVGIDSHRRHCYHCHRYHCARLVQLMAGYE